MKKINRKILVSIVTTCAFSFVVHSASTFSATTTIVKDNVVYLLDAATLTASVKGEDQESPIKDIVIEQTVEHNGDHYTTTHILDEGFERFGLTSVVIPNSVTSIGEYAFYYNDLTEVMIPNAVTTIEEGTFWMNELTEVTIPDSVTTIGYAAFARNQIEKVVLSNSLSVIGRAAFNINSIKSIVIPDSVKVIEEYAFDSNELTELDIPNSITEIENGAFSSNQLTKISIPDSVTTIGSFAFEANQLTELAIPSSVTTIGDGSFGRNQINFVSIPASVNTMGNFIFYNNPLEHVVLESMHQADIVRTNFEQSALPNSTLPIVKLYALDHLSTAYYQDTQLDHVLYEGDTATFEIGETHLHQMAKFDTSTITWIPPEEDASILAKPSDLVVTWTPTALTRQQGTTFTIDSASKMHRGEYYATVNGIVLPTIKVDVLVNTHAVVQHLDTTGKLLSEDIVSGYSSEGYTTVARSFTDYVLVETPNNAHGIFGDDPIQVQYQYQALQTSITDGKLPSTGMAVSYTAIPLIMMGIGCFLLGFKKRNILK